MNSWTTPTAEQLDRALAMLTQAQFYRRFFEGLKNPLWIVPLREKGLFSHPSPAERNEERGTIGFRAWPASEFLTRMASEAPEAVTETILSVPATDNFRVHEDFIDAALLLPVDLAARIANKEIEWLKGQERLFTLFPDKLGKLCVHLAVRGKKETASRLLSSLLEIRADPAQSTKDTSRKELRALTHIDVWHYRDTLKKYLPKLAPALGVSAVALLCDLLDSSLNITEKDRAESGQDHSYIWRPAIETHSQNMEGQLNSVLVAGCRDAAEFLLQGGVAQLNDVVEILDRKKWLIFRRLALHLLRKFAPAGSPEIAAHFSSRALFDEIGLRHEYTSLLRERIGEFSDEIVAPIFGWIEAGPDLERWKKSEEEWSGKRPSDEDATRYRQIWQRERLAWFQDRLPARWREHFVEVLEKFPAPEHPDFPSYMTTEWVGPESPKSAEELGKLSTSQLVSFLRSWTPPAQTTMEATREGLGRALGDIVKADPKRYAEEAADFIGLDPTYVRSVIQGIEEALRADSKLQVDNVLPLCQWAVQQERVLSQPRGKDEDPDWSWSRKTIASFLKFALQKQAVALEKRKVVWKILSPITSDPDPMPEDEPEERPENSMGPETLSINTARGQAIHAAIQYALWVRRHWESDPDAKAKLNSGLEEMPEVRAVLNEHLDPEKDPSPAVRSVYGQWFPWLLLIDPTWAREAVPRIFPTATASDRQRDAAWLTYLSFCHPYDNVFDALKDQYALAIDRLGADAHIKSRYGDPDERIGQHFAAYYWRGKLTLDPDSLLVRYLTKATDKMRGSVVEYIGRSLANTKEAAPENVLARLTSLWDWLMDSGPLASGITSEAAADFGWWFISEKLPDDWSLPRLVAAVRRAKKIEPEHLVAERLAKMASSKPLESVQVFDVLARNDKEGWNVSHWDDQATATLEHAYRSSSTEAKKAATELIHYLGSRGYMSFGKILSHSGD